MNLIRNTKTQKKTLNSYMKPWRISKYKIKILPTLIRDQNPDTLLKLKIEKSKYAKHIKQWNKCWKQQYWIKTFNKIEKNHNVNKIKEILNNSIKNIFNSAYKNLIEKTYFENVYNETSSSLVKCQSNFKCFDCQHRFNLTSREPIIMVCCGKTACK
jgi:hypothetical protein